MSRIARELRAWIDACVAAVPGGIGVRLRRLWLGRRLAHLGATSSFGRHVEILWGENITIGANLFINTGSMLGAEAGQLSIGDRVSINRHVLINAADGGRIEIRNDVLIGPNVVIRASDHAFASGETPINRQGHVPGTIVIEDDVWLASNVVVVGDVRIGAHSVVAAGAVVTKDVEPWSVVGGVPAKLIRKRQ